MTYIDGNRYTKCIGITQDKRYILKYEDCSIIELSHIEIMELIKSKEIGIINLYIEMPAKEIRYRRSPAVIREYKKLLDKSKSEESERAYYKSCLLQRETAKDGSRQVVTNNNEGTLVFTDRTTEFANSIRADTMIFVGNKPLKNIDNEKYIKLRCFKAIIQNRCVYANLMGTSRIHLWANRIYLKHEFIDKNTVYEIAGYLIDLINYKNESMADTIFIVDFEKAGIDTKDIFNETMKVIDKELKEDESKNTLPCASLACSMYVSTEYKFDMLLTMASKLLDNCCIRYFGVIPEEHVRVETILNSLKHGERY